MEFHWIAFMALSLAILVASYPTGHPANGCESMVPAHGARPSSDPPYTVTMSVKCYDPGKEIDVKISGDVLRGFFVRSMKVGDDLSNDGVGKFKISGDDVQLLCKDAGATHTNNTIKQMMTLKWMAPPSNTGPVVFQATVVKRLSLFWLEIMSKELEECQGGPKPKTTTKPVRPKSTPSPKRPCKDRLSREKPEKVKINKIPKIIKNCQSLKGRRSRLCSKDALGGKCCESCKAHTCVNSLTWKLERGRKCTKCTCDEIKKKGLMKDCCSRRNRWRGEGHNGRIYSCRRMCCKFCAKIESS